ncbi:ABC transporter substrate-binding protein [Vineibacter terrae]|uniref:ABC transporter substrate-binding protein n=1 Tax=Vineibacter terrae TaxID=2586908 RepID=UPI002E3387C9|nr:ABC transporter substrate-binding protein [Vineibacter terrae]HEX2888978.1 ABC transporter substrate-binding protein [Vineibacter terrae]
MHVFHKLGAGVLAAALAVTSGAAWAQTRIEFFFPVPVEGKLAREMTRLVKQFNDAQKDVEVTAVYTGSYDETKLKAQAAAKAGKPPSVVLMSANFNVDLKLAGDILSLEPFLAKEGTTRSAFLGDFWPALHANATVDGALYGVPFHNSTPLLYFNADHFKEAGLDPANPPRTWAELVDAAKKLTKRDGEKIERHGFMMPGNYDTLGWLMSALSMSNGGRYFNESYGGEVYYDTPSMVGAARLVEDLVHKHKVMPAGVVDSGAVSTAFFAGKASMILQSTGSLSFIRENMKSAYSVAFVPRNVRNAVPIGGASLVMFKGQSEASREAGWKFIRWLSSTEVLAGWSRFTGYFAPRKSAYDMPEMKEFIARHPDAKVALDQLAYAQPWFATFQTVAVRKALEDEMQAVLNGKKKADQAVRDAQRKADELLRPYVEQTALKLP